MWRHCVKIQNMRMFCNQRRQKNMFRSEGCSPRGISSLGARDQGSDSIQKFLSRRHAGSMSQTTLKMTHHGTGTWSGLGFTKLGQACENLRMGRVTGMARMGLVLGRCFEKNERGLGSTKIAWAPENTLCSRAPLIWGSLYEMGASHPTHKQ